MTSSYKLKSECLKQWLKDRKKPSKQSAEPNKFQDIWNPNIKRFDLRS